MAPMEEVSRKCLSRSQGGGVVVHDTTATLSGAQVDFSGCNLYGNSASYGDDIYVDIGSVCLWDTTYTEIYGTTTTCTAPPPSPPALPPPLAPRAVAVVGQWEPTGDYCYTSCPSNPCSASYTVGVSESASEETTEAIEEMYEETDSGSITTGSTYSFGVDVGVEVSVHGTTAQYSAGYETTTTTEYTEGYEITSGVAESLATTFASSVETSSSVENTYSYCGVLWHFVFYVSFIDGTTSYVNSNILATTDNEEEAPCCIPGHISDPTYPHGSCTSAEMCITASCSLATCGFAPAPPPNAPAPPPPLLPPPPVCSASCIGETCTYWSELYPDTFTCDALETSHG